VVGERRGGNLFGRLGEKRKSCETSHCPVRKGEKDHSSMIKCKEKLNGTWSHDDKKKEEDHLGRGDKRCVLGGIKRVDTRKAGGKKFQKTEYFWGELGIEGGTRQGLGVDIEGFKEFEEWGGRAWGEESTL